MSLLDIFRLVGFATGAALHFYLVWLLSVRRGLRLGERALVALGISLGAWHLGNFLASAYALIGGTGAPFWLKLANSLAYAGLALLPPLLAHSHFRLWESLDERAPRRFFVPLIVLGYVPVVVLMPWAMAELWREPYLEPIERLSPLLVPFVSWFVFIFLECAAIDFWLSRRMKGSREGIFFRTFGVSLAGIGVLFFLTYVLGLRYLVGVGPYLDTFARLSSLIPTTVIAYYIYRYRFLELVIRQSLVYAVFAMLVMMIYIFGIRRIALAFQALTEIRSEVVEAVLILGLMFLAGPLRRVTERYLQKLFIREVGLYRDLVAQVGAEAAGYSELNHFVNFAEKRISESLGISSARLIARDRADAETRELALMAEERFWTQVEDHDLLEKFRALACYVLWREDHVVGLLFVSGHRSELTVEKREVLSVLSGHLAVAIENCQLLEEKVTLERELASRERLAALGQMAATIAHEVKNPLSSIKSITQVMREDPAVESEYGRDLNLINGEIDRLNRSVSQLLSFSRPAVVAATQTQLSEIVSSITTLTRTDLDTKQQRLKSSLTADHILSGHQSAALREILMNLVLNASQSAEEDTEIAIESSWLRPTVLTVSVTDSGPGIPAALREKVFEPFFTTRQRGSGLGLSIVARRVRELEGEIRLESPVGNQGRGTRFRVTFRVKDQTEMRLERNSQYSRLEG